MHTYFLSLLVAHLGFLSTGYLNEMFRLQEDLKIGQQFLVNIRTELTGKVTLPPDLAKDKKQNELVMTGSSNLDYVEKVLTLQTQTQPGRIVRFYRHHEYKRKVNGEPLENTLRPTVRRVVVTRSGRGKTGFSPDGPLSFAEIEMLRSDVFAPALLGLLPSRPVKVGEGWKATADAVRELTDLEQVHSGDLDCLLQEVVSKGEQQYALVRFKGTVEGIGTDGPNRQKLDGYLHVDLNMHHMSHLFFNGTSWLLDQDGKPRGQIEGRFILNRKLVDAPELSAATLGNLVLEPNPDNTKLLFTEPTLGVELTHPRHWTMRHADARQIVLDEPNGNGLLVTLEPADRAPTVETYRKEVEAWLQKEQVKVLRREEPQRLQSGVDTVDRFSYEAEIKGQRCFLDYYVLRQAAAGATCAARWEINGAAALQAEGERIVKSLHLTKPRKP